MSKNGLTKPFLVCWTSGFVSGRILYMNGKIKIIKQVEENIKSHILKCRLGDWEHAKRVAKWVNELGRDREDLFVLMTVAYIHDIGWRNLISEKMTFEQLLELEPQANKNSEPYIKEVLKELKYSVSDIEKVLRLVKSADKHESSREDEAIIVDADSLSKLNINHLREKYQSTDWMKMYNLWNNEFPNRIKTDKAKKLFPSLLKELKEDISKESA